MTTTRRAAGGNANGRGTLLDALRRGGWRAVIAQASGLSADERRGLRRDLAGLAAAAREPRAATRAARPTVMGKTSAAANRDKPRQGWRTVPGLATPVLGRSREWMTYMHRIAAARAYGRRLRENPALMEPLRRASREWWIGRRVRFFEEEAPHAAQVLGPAGVRDVVSRVVPREKSEARVRRWIRRRYGLDGGRRSV